MNSEERRILIVTCFGHFLSHFNMLVFPALVLPLSGLLHLPMPQVLALSFWMYLLFGLMALPWGMVGDRFGAKALIIVMFLGAGAGGLAAAFFVESPAGLSLALASVGFFSAIYHPIGLGLISKGVRRISVAMGYNGVFGTLGLVLAPLVAGLGVWLSGPRAAFAAMGGLNLVGVAIMAFLPIEEPKKQEETVSEGNNGMLGAFLILLVAMMLGGLAYRGASVILPAYLELKGHGIVESISAVLGTGISGNLVATSVTSVIYMVAVLGQYVGGHVGDRFECRYAYLLFHAICVPTALLMAFTQNLVLVCLAFVYFFFLLGMQPIENTLVATYSPRKWHHSAYGMKFILTFGVGALSVKIIERIESLWGVDAIFIALSIVSVGIVSAIMALIYRTSRSVPQDAEVTGQCVPDSGG